MDKRDNARGELAEQIIKDYYEKKGFKVIRLIIANKGPQLNFENLESFLGEENQSLLFTIEGLYNQHKLLPDFLLRNLENRFLFVEVKSRKGKVTLSNTEEKFSIKVIANEGFKVFIENVRIPFYDYIDKKEAKRQNREYGLILKGILKKPKWNLKIENRKKQSNPQENIEIWNSIAKEI